MAHRPDLLPAELEQRLDAVAHATGRTKEECLVEAVTDYLEDREDVAIADQRVADLRAGRDETISLSELLDQYGLAR